MSRPTLTRLYRLVEAGATVDPNSRELDWTTAEREWPGSSVVWDREHGDESILAIVDDDGNLLVGTGDDVYIWDRHGRTWATYHMIRMAINGSWIRLYHPLSPGSAMYVPRMGRG